MPILALTLLLQIAVPPPRGYVNDFAGVLDAASVAHMEAVIAEVRDKTRGELAVVTLPDIDDRPAAGEALEIGRRGGVGGGGGACPGGGWAGGGAGAAGAVAGAVAEAGAGAGSAVASAGSVVAVDSQAAAREGGSSRGS